MSIGWSEVSPGRWERGTDGLEGYFIVMANITASLCEGKEHYTLFSKLKLDASSSENVQSALKYAWKQIRYEQPHIATTVDGMKKVYVVPDEKGIEQWLADTFVVSPAPDAESLYQSVKPIKQATLYYVAASSELVFRGHHHTIDGTGILLFWHSYLSALAAPMKAITYGSETSRLPLTLEEVLGYPAEGTDAQNEKAMALFMSWAGSIPGIGPMSSVGTKPSGACQNSELVFPAKTTAALVQACKAKGITVTAAVHAAYIMVLVKHADPESKLAQYVSANQFDLRPYLPEPYSSSKYAVSVYYTPLPYKIDLPASFWDNAKALDTFYKTSFKGNPEALQLKGLWTRILCGAVQTPEFLAGPVPKDALVSSLGVVEKYVQRQYGSYKVQDIKIGVDVILGMSMFFFYTFDEKLRLIYSFNDGYEDGKNIKMYLEETQKILVEELLA